MADNNFDTVKSELDEIYGLLQSLANNISGLNTSAANLRKAADDTSRSAKEVSNSTKSELNEYKTVLGGLAKESKDLTDSIKAGKSLLKDSSSLVDSAQRAIQDSMTFSNKSMSEAFSFGKKVSAYKAQADREIAEAQRNMNNVIEEMDKAIKKMQDAAAANGEAVEDNAEYQKLLAERNAAESRKLEMDNIKEIGYSRVKAQNELKTKAINMLKGAIDTIAAYYQKAFANAYSSVMSAYENTYHDITSYNAYSKKEYNQVIDSMQAFIKENGLNESINMSDYLEEVKGVLQGGLTGPLAEQVAKYSILSKEGGISADFSDQSFQKMIKKVYDQKLQETGSEQEALAASEGLLEQIMTQSKAVIEETGDSFGFANGQINTMMNSIWEMSSIMNMTDEAVKKSTTSMTALNGVLGKTGMDTTAIYEQIEKYASEGFNGSSALAMLNFSGMDSEQAKAEIAKNGVGSLIEKTISGIYRNYSGNAGEFQKAINDALGSDYDLKSIQSMLSTYKTEEDFMKAYKGAMSAAQGTDSDAYMAGLKEFNTEAEQLNNYAENFMTDSAQLAQESNLIRIGVDSLVDYFTGNKVSNIFGSIADLGNLLVNAFGKGGGNIGDNLVSKVTGKLTSTFGKTGSIGKFFNNGTAFASKGGSLAKVGSKVFSTGGKALGVAGTLVSMGLDAYSGYKEDSAEGAFRGAITGSGKAAESGWDIAKGAGSAAFKGAGIGMMFGPLGVAIGAAVGGLTGLAVGLNDYLDEQNRAARTIKNVDAAYTKMKESVEEYQAEKEKLAVIEEDYAKIVNENGEAIIGATPPASIAEKYPQLSAYLDENGAVTQQYTELLEKLIAADERANAAKLLNTNFDTLKQTSSTDLNNTMNVAEDAKKGSEFVDIFNDSNNKIESMSQDAMGNTTVTYTDASGKKQTKSISSSALDAIGVTAQDLINMSSQNEGGINTFTKTDAEGNVYNVNAAKDSDSLLSSTVAVTSAKSNAQNKLDDAYITQLKYAETFFKPASAFFKDNNITLKSSYGKDEKTDEEWSKFATDAGDRWDATIKDVFDTYNTGLTNLKNYDWKNGPLKLDDIELKSWDDVVARYGSVSPSKLLAWQHAATNSNAWFSGGNLDYTPAFKTGLSYVPYDNFLARLHKGERVQTAAEVNLEKANYAADGSSKMAAALQDSLVRQTDVIIGLLQDILGAIGGKSTSASEYMEELNAYSYTVGLPSNS